MSSSISNKPETPEPEPATQQPKILETENQHKESTDPSLIDEENKDKESTDPSLIDEEKQDQEGEDEGECGFCLFMKGGSCRETFINWEKCIEEGEKKNEDIVEKCFEVTSALKTCMEAHPDYYGPILQAEKAAEQEAINQLDKKKEDDKKETEAIEAA